MESGEGLQNRSMVLTIRVLLSVVVCFGWVEDVGGTFPWDGRKGKAASEMEGGRWLEEIRSSFSCGNCIHVDLSGRGWKGYCSSNDAISLQSASPDTLPDEMALRFLRGLKCARVFFEMSPNSDLHLQTLRVKDWTRSVHEVQTIINAVDLKDWCRIATKLNKFEATYLLIPELERNESCSASYQVIFNDIGRSLIKLEFPLMGSKLTVSSAKADPYVMVNGSEYSGAEVQIIKDLAKYRNFSVNFTSPRDGAWGQLRNGTWTGMVGDVVEGRADVAFS